MKISNEARIGMMVAAVVIFLSYLTIKSGDFNFSQKGYTVKVLFNNIDGINLNAPVMLNGLEVGKVQDINIVEQDNITRLELIVWLNEDAKLTVGTKAFAKNMGFFGEKYVGFLVAGSGSGYLQPGAVIEGRDPADLDKLLIDGQEIALDVKQISQNINERLAKNRDAIDRIIANLDVSSAHVTSITASLDERMRINHQRIDETLANLHSASTNLDQFTYDLKMNPWKLLYRSREKKQRSIDSLTQENAVQR